MDPNRLRDGRCTDTDRRSRPDRLARRSDPATRDTSAGWREEYQHAHVALPDGGVRELPGVQPGDRVRDRDDQDDELVVVSVHNIRADEYILSDVDGEPTVAEVNEEYPASAPVVHAVYDDELDEIGHAENPEILREAVDRGVIRSHAFPVDRLGGEKA